MAVTGIQLPNTGVTPGQALAANFTTAGTVVTIVAQAVPWAKFVCKHEGTGGFWYGRYQGGTPTTLVYDFKISPGESHQLDNPPLGAVNILASGSTIGNLSFSADWRQ